MAAVDYLIVPFTADDSSRRAIENVVSLLYGYGVNDPKREIYAKINFSQKAKELGVNIPKLHTFVNNRVIMWGEKPSKAFDVINRKIKETMDNIHKRHRGIYANPKELPSDSFIELPDYHGVCVIATTTGTPLHILKPGPRDFNGERVQINKEPLEKYRKALTNLVNCL